MSSALAAELQCDVVMRYAVYVAVILAGLAATAPRLNADESVTVSVYPTMTVSHGSTSLKVFIQRSEQNRMLTWEVDGPDYYRSSSAQLDGADAPRAWFYILQNIPPGTFEVRAKVKRANNSEAIATTQLVVVPGGKN